MLAPRKFAERLRLCWDLDLLAGHENLAGHLVDGVAAGYVVSVFFFQAEDGIRDYKVTGVQTCALPISAVASLGTNPSDAPRNAVASASNGTPSSNRVISSRFRRVACCCRASRCSPGPIDRKSVV